MQVSSYNESLNPDYFARPRSNSLPEERARNLFPILQSQSRERVKRTRLAGKYALKEQSEDYKLHLL